MKNSHTFQYIFTLVFHPVIDLVHHNLEVNGSWAVLEMFYIPGPCLALDVDQDTSFKKEKPYLCWVSGRGITISCFTWFRIKNEYQSFCVYFSQLLLSSKQHGYYYLLTRSESITPPRHSFCRYNNNNNIELQFVSKSQFLVCIIVTYVRKYNYIPLQI